MYELQNLSGYMLYRFFREKKRSFDWAQFKSEMILVGKCLGIVGLGIAGEMAMALFFKRLVGAVVLAVVAVFCFGCWAFYRLKEKWMR
jgi:amino acid permease